MTEVAPIERGAGRRPAAGAAAVLVAVSVWGAAAVITRIVDQVNGLVLAFHRLWIGAAVTLIVFYVSGRRLTWTTLRKSIPGGLAFAADIVLFFTALRHTTVANATIVGALQPALVMIVAGPMFGEPVTAGIIGWSVAAFIGVAVVVYGSSGAPTWSIGGDLLAVGALFAWTLYFIASKRVRRDLPSFDYLTALLIIATVTVAPLALLFGGALDPGGADSWAWICVLAIGSGGMGHLLINWAHDHVDLTVMSLLTLAIPVFAVASAAIFLDESVTWVQVFGMLIVLGALSVVAVSAARSEPSSPIPLESEAM